MSVSYGLPDKLYLVDDSTFAQRRSQGSGSGVKVVMEWSPGRVGHSQNKTSNFSPTLLSRDPSGVYDGRLESGLGPLRLKFDPSIPSMDALKHASWLF